MATAKQLCNDIFTQSKDRQADRESIVRQTYESRIL